MPTSLTAISQAVTALRDSQCDVALEAVLFDHLPAKARLHAKEAQGLPRWPAVR